MKVLVIALVVCAVYAQSVNGYLAHLRRYGEDTSVNDQQRWQLGKQQTEQDRTNTNSQEQDDTWAMWADILGTSTNNNNNNNNRNNNNKRNNNNNNRNNNNNNNNNSNDDDADNNNNRYNNNNNNMKRHNNNNNNNFDMDNRNTNTKSVESLPSAENIFNKIRARLNKSWQLRSAQETKNFIMKYATEKLNECRTINGQLDKHCSSVVLGMIMRMIAQIEKSPVDPRGVIPGFDNYGF